MPEQSILAPSRRKLLAALTSMSLALSVDARAQTTPDPQAILAAADKIRVPQTPFRMQVTLTDYFANKQQAQVTLAVLSKIDAATREFKTLVTYMAPARDLGKVVLFSGTSLWFFDPSSKATVRISPQQRLIGQAANGDIVTTNLSVDYQAAMAGTETIKGADKADHDCWHLELKPAGSAAIYGRIELWVERSTSRPIKGKFYAQSGKLLKIAYYNKYQNVLGAERPTEVILIDALDAKAATIMSSSAYAAQSIPDTWFQRDYLSQVR
jgi:hypothetical protein